MSQTRPVTLHLRLTREQHMFVQALADSEGRPVAQMLAVLIREAIDQRAERNDNDR